MLASLPKSANQYSPINYPQNALRRRNLVLNAMLEDGKITAQQANDAKASPITLHLQSQTRMRWPHISWKRSAATWKRNTAVKRAPRRHAGLHHAQPGMAEGCHPRRARRPRGLRASPGWKGNLKNILWQRDAGYVRKS